MIRTFSVAMVGAVVLAAGPAWAQTSDIDQTFAAGVEGVAQAFGQAAFAGPSLFVTAKGHTKLPAPIADSYVVAVEAKNASAVQATRERDAKVAQLLAFAHRSGVAVEQGETSLSLETLMEAQQRASAASMEAHAQNPTLPVGNTAFPPKLFIAKADLRFRAPATSDLAAFFDAVHAAGVDDISRGLGGPANPFMPRTGEMFGFGSVETLDDSIWNAAGGDAIRKARSQGAALAAAGGRSLGSVQSIIVLGRGADGDQATESLGVRFALTDAAR